MKYRIVDNIYDVHTASPFIERSSLVSQAQYLMSAFRVYGRIVLWLYWHQTWTLELDDERTSQISCHKQSEAERSSSHNIASITLTLKSSLLSIRHAITELFCYRRHPALVITFIHSFHVIYLFISLFVYESFARCLWSSVSHHCFCLVYIMSVVCICNAI